MKTFAEMLGAEPVRLVQDVQLTATVRDLAVARYAATLESTSTEDLRRVRRELARVVAAGGGDRGARRMQRARLGCVDRELGSRR